ncbi:uncharacterized protein LOC110382490 isoform X1 [Helicoverpa armigera]|uniref:uncharacterized protein LOC110382490 isoform X1 n=1 Tax=Helicoverpa armigera TaxID=29058 RepID=UPI003082838D
MASLIMTSENTYTNTETDYTHPSSELETIHVNTEVENTHPNTESENTEKTDSPRETHNLHKTETVAGNKSHASSSTDKKSEFSKPSFQFLRTQIDTDSDNIKAEYDRDYKDVSGVNIRDCGEPLRPQVLRIDFNPGVDDDDFMQKKCVDFWKFINDHPELSSLKVKANKESVTKESSTNMTSSETASSTASSGSSGGYGLTPITMMSLDWLKNGELMNHALATKAVIKPCELVTKYDEYSQNKPDDWPPGKKPVARVHRVPNLVPRSSSKSRAHSSNKINQDKSLKLMLAEMKRWDSQHPKSMKPPNNPPGFALEKPERILLPYIAPNEDKYCEKCIN